MRPLFRVQPAYDLPRLRLLPLREQPAYRVTANSDLHNHPSGDPTPSPEDVAITRDITEAG